MRERTGHFVFVSSGNVYADHGTPARTRAAPLLPALGGPVMQSMDSYGEAKVACEQHVLGTFGPDALPDRPGGRQHRGPLIRADPEWYWPQGVQPWMGPRSLPLWLTDRDWQGFNARASDAARRAGLVTRPLAATLADTLAWALTRDPDRSWVAGLSTGDERELIAAWRTR